MPRFEVLAGKYVEGSTTYAKGQVLKSKHELDTMFIGKFKRVGEVDLASPPEEAPVLEVKKRTITIGKPKATDVVTLAARGENVTTQFKVGDAFVKVFKRGAAYHIYDGDDTSPINEKPLTKGAVAGAIKEYAEE